VVVHILARLVVDKQLVEHIRQALHKMVPHKLEVRRMALRRQAQEHRLAVVLGQQLEPFFELEQLSGLELRLVLFGLERPFFELVLEQLFVEVVGHTLVAKLGVEHIVGQLALVLVEP